MNLALGIEFGRKTRRLLHRIIDLLEHRIPLTGGQIVFILKDDNPDVGYSITAPEARDSEGNVIPDANLSYEVSSSDDAIVSISPSPDDPKSGTVHFGAPGQAAVNVNVKSGETLLGAFGAQFTITTGDPAAIAGGSIAFDGLTES